MHVDYGLGSFIGVDGADHTPGNQWGHLQLAPAMLSAGDHEFESLGFEDCCDGHAELEVHLNCDSEAAAWRLVVSGETDCLACTHTALSHTCSAAAQGQSGDQGGLEYGQASHCGTSGSTAGVMNGITCTSSAGGCGSDASYFDGEDFFTESHGINPGSHQFSVDFKYKTAGFINQGVMMHSGRTDASGKTDHVAFELQNEHVVFDFSTGESPVRIESDDGSDTEGRWHYVSGTRHGQAAGMLQVDGHTIPGPTVEAQGSSIGTTGPLYIGGQPDILSEQTQGLSALNNFVGCMGGIHYEQLFEMVGGGGTSYGSITPGACGNAPGVYVSGDNDVYSDCASCCADDAGCRHCEQHFPPLTH